MTDTMFDDLEELDAAPSVERQPQAGASELGGGYLEPCARCRGTGNTRWGTCFACKGARSRAFKNPPAVRAANRGKAAARRARDGAENLEAFKADHPAEWAWLEERVTWELAKANGQDWGQKTKAAIARYGDLTDKWMAAVHAAMAKRATALEARAATTKPPETNSNFLAAYVGEEASSAPADGTEEVKLERAQIARPIDIMTFLTAGNATFTLEGSKSRFTFRVARSKDGKLFFISVLTGPDNTADYAYVGVIRGSEFALTAKSRMTKDTPSVVAFAWFWRALVHKDEEDLAKVRFFHECHCGRCGRPLTVPASVKRGIGPDCAEMMGLP